MSTFIGKKVVAKSIGAAAAPVPVNTPSLKSENKGKDVSVTLVPQTNSSAAWSQSSQSATKASDSPLLQPVAAPTSVAAKPAPWAKPGTAPVAVEEVAAAPVPTPTAVVTKSWAAADEDSDDDDRPAEPKKDHWAGNVRDKPLDEPVDQYNSGGQRERGYSDMSRYNKLKVRDIIFHSWPHVIDRHTLLALACVRFRRSRILR